MPELPEVETIARQLRPALVGQVIKNVEVLWERTVEKPSADEFCEATLTGVTRRGKYLVFTLDTDQTLLVHLRMTGKFILRHPDQPGDGNVTHVRARMLFEDGTRLLFSDTRKFGRFYLVDDSQEILADLGPEPLAPGFTADAFAQKLRKRRGEIKRLLLDQRFIAGIGNIYVSEALWRARVHPQRLANSLTEEEAHRLHAAIITTLKHGIKDGGTSLGDRQYVYPDGGLGRHQEQLAVYERAEEACPRCHYAIERIVQGQRSTYFCPVCQKLPQEPSSKGCP